MFNFKNRVAVVTGASSGLGVQFATALARQGADVALLARRLERLESLAGELKNLGVRALPVACDVTRPEAVRDAVAMVMKEFGKADILVNCAGGDAGSDALNTTDEDWGKVMALNINSIFTCCREFGREMIKKGYGRIINIASMYGMVGNNFAPAPAYHASKGAVVNFTRALAAEWAKTGVTVNAIGPGFFDTELTHKLFDDKAFNEAIKVYCPMGRTGKSGELDGAVVYLASDEASYTTGITLCVDGGWTAI